MNPPRVIVVGAGPAGMMAAIRAAQCQAEVTIFEKNPRLGVKLFLTGKGRCNLTNAASLEEFLTRFGRNGQFLRDAFRVFFNKELMDFFESRKVTLKVERQLRVFPESDKAETIVSVLKGELAKLKIRQEFLQPVDEIIISEEKKVQGVKVRGVFLPAEKVIIATGGASYPSTGSDGTGLKMAKSVGHNLTPLSPGLVPLVTEESFIKRLEGLTLKNIRLTFNDGKKNLVTEIGELLFTSFGVSGPLVLSHSADISQWCADKKVRLKIDLKPALSIEQLKNRLDREIADSPNRSVKIFLKSFLPIRMIEVFLECLKIDGQKKVNQLMRQERLDIVAFLKNFTLTVKGPLSIREAMVTRGGVSLKEVNPRTMESRLVGGLYFAGEILDLDADTGGFNLQAAFSTGYLAGESASTA